MPSRETDSDEPVPGGSPPPDWESELRRGQVADGGHGSVDAELGIVNLLRHARGPAQLSSGELDQVWGAVRKEVAPRAWWRRPWALWGVPAVLAAAALVLVLLPRHAEFPAEGDAPLASAGSMGGLLEQQFLSLEPQARVRVSAAVRRGRVTLRDQLLARVVAGSTRTHGGAP